VAEQVAQAADRQVFQLVDLTGRPVLNIKVQIHPNDDWDQVLEAPVNELGVFTVSVWEHWFGYSMASSSGQIDSDTGEFWIGVHWESPYPTLYEPLWFSYKYPTDYTSGVKQLKYDAGPIWGGVWLFGTLFPIEGLTITNSTWPSITAETSKEDPGKGFYTLTNMNRKATYVGVQPPDPGFIFWPTSTNVGPGATWVNFYLTHGPIRGRATLARQGLPDVTVNFYLTSDKQEKPVRTETTDDSGRFAAELLSANFFYNVIPSLDDFTFENYDVYRSPVTTNVYEFKVRTGPIQGWVRDENGGGIEGVTITATNGTSQFTVSTTAGGRFAFENLPVGTSGRYFLTLTPKTGYRLPTRPIEAPISTHEVIILAGYQVFGRVTSAVDLDLGIPNVLMEAQAQEGGAASRSVRTDQDGRYNLLGLTPNKAYTLTATSPGLDLGQSIPLRTEGPYKEQDFTARSLILGRILWADGGLGGVTITARDGDKNTAGTATSDAQGNYRLLLDYSAPRMTVTAARDGFSFQPGARQALPGPTAVDVDFQASGGISGRITFKDGSSVPGIQVQAFLVSGGGQTAVRHGASVAGLPPLIPAAWVETDADGRYRFDTLLAGATYRIVPTAVGFDFSGPIVVPAGASEVNCVVVGAPPSITPLNDQFIARNSRTPVLSFTVTDGEDPPRTLQVTYDSSNPALVPNAPTPYVVFTTNGAQRTIQIVPAPDQAGTATILLSVRDSDGNSVSTQFDVNVDVQPAYAVIDLGDSEIFDTSRGVDINDTGQVVGTFTTAGGGQGGFVSSSQEPDKPDVIPALTNSLPKAINNDGFVVGVSHAAGVTNAFSYDPQTGQQINLHNQLDNARLYSEAVDINRDGWIVANVFDAASIRYPFVLTGQPGTATPLSTDPWPAMAVSDSGLIVGQSSDRRAVVWMNRGSEPVFVGTNRLLAPYAVNSAGWIVGQTLQPSGGKATGFRAFLLRTNDVPGTNLVEFTLPNGGVSVAFGINDRNEIVGHPHPQSRDRRHRAGGRVH